MKKLKEHPIDENITEVHCYRFRTQNTVLTELTGTVSEPFKRGFKVLRIFYPEDDTEIPFFVDAIPYTLRRGIVWAPTRNLDIRSVIDIFICNKSDEREKAVKYVNSFDDQIEYLVKLKNSTYADIREAEVL